MNQREGSKSIPGAMPVLFIGHGSPMNAVEDNSFVRVWKETARQLPKVKAVLCISAHWESEGTFLSTAKHPSTIYDFYGFPDELYSVQYPAPGSMWLADEVKRLAGFVRFDGERGLDHGCWVVMRRFFPQADVPVVQLSLDVTHSPHEQYDLAAQLMPLRDKGVLILCSGNMVHNLGMIAVRGGDINESYGFPWALEASTLMKKHIDGRDHKALIEYRELGPAVQMAVPTSEHYLPMLYALALRKDDEPLVYFNDTAIAGSLTMTSFRIG
ncbi:MAG: 4,5-DOPA dioxygenase extradiol [Spirochaetes bacterium]|nr:4,5-DOPA dioxygenase extradiol [Spirochaetota bacterium]